MDYVEFCKSTYNFMYEKKYLEYLAGRSAKAAMESSERLAQHEAIVYTFQTAIDEYAKSHDATEIWNAIYRAHILRKININDINDIDEEVVNAIISASQSWKKCSGHVFEDYIVRSTEDRLSEIGISFVLQKTLSQMLFEGRIANSRADNISEIVKDDVFDIYAIKHVDNQNIVFGCLQVKTSIRDRVVRDRGFSIPIMNRNIWSAIIVLDGKYMSMPKFEAMVNGGTNQYRENGWHGMYCMSNAETNDRIYEDTDLRLLIQDALESADTFLASRQLLTPYWQATRD